ncbi:unnamed protein product [Cylindrotheca closterium]|uniref:JmjC domain-containing protein n=1 Tax=Cylindrotheca closterium TaxID=2856 RepID=A0AAD2CN56_9STRA|nr:unnamed protein product [Cylindrotheca closterium]
MNTEGSANPNRTFRSHDRHRVTRDSRWGLNNTFNQSTHCLLEPIPGYPVQFNLLQMLEAWPIDEINGPEARQDTSYQSLCVFQWSNALDRKKMERYRKLELPFIMAGDPEVLEAAHRWNKPGYLVKMLGQNTKYTTEYSPTNHYIYVNQILKARYKGDRKKRKRNPGLPEGGKEEDKTLNITNTIVQMTYLEWLALAHETENATRATSRDAGPQSDSEKPHWYFKFMTCGTYEKGECKSTANVTTSRLATLGTELRCLSDPKSFYIIEADKQKGRIQCKFGMAGITSQAHFDTPRNFLVLLGGKRRYILSRPGSGNYANFYIHSGAHPSARHSAVNWSTPNLTEHPMFAKARATEAVLKTGEVLYIPPKWIHSIVSLSITMQCNSWSGSKNNR